MRRPAGRPTPPAVAAVSAAPGAASEPLSADLDAHLRRIGIAAAERILATATEQGWTKPAGSARAAR